MPRTGCPIEATRQGQRIRTVIFNRVQPLFYGGSSLKQVRKMLDGWVPFGSVDVREVSYGVWKRPCPSPPEVRLSPFDRCRTPCMDFVSVEAVAEEAPADEPPRGHRGSGTPIAVVHKQTDVKL